MQKAKSMSPETQLLRRAHQVAGLTVADLASRLGQRTPANLLSNKGWMGQLLERWLNAQSASKAQPDFPELGIELKTLPVSLKGRPLESTYVCMAPLLELAQVSFDNSVVAAKLRKVLFVPIIGARNWPPGQRQIGQAFYWQPSASQWARVRRDFEELTELIATGHIDRIDGRLGQVLQIRPKGPNGQALTASHNASGEKILTLPRGFYLRASFTQEILTRAMFSSLSDQKTYGVT